MPTDHAPPSAGDAALARLPPVALVAFLTGAFGLAWACWLPIVVATRVAGQPPHAPIPMDASALLAILGTAAPSLASFAVAARWGGWPAVRALAARLVRWRVGARWYAVALLLPPGVMAAAIALHVALGATRPDFPALSAWPLVLVNLAAVFALGGPLGEEAGWRGLALPFLERRLGLAAASVGLGIVWAIWHLPLAFIAGTPQHEVPFAVFALQVIGASVLLAWLYRASGHSLFVVMLAHASMNGWAGPLRILPSATGSMRPIALASVLLGVVALGIVAHEWARGFPRRVRRDRSGPLR